MRPVPGGRWGLVWLCTLVIVVVSAIGLEAFVRSRGYVPSVKDDEYMWSLERARAADGSHRTMAILGASRILLAFSPQAFRETLPDWKYVQLAKQGSFPLAALRDLALDPAFKGIALVDLQEGAFDTINAESQRPLVETYHRGWRTIGQLVERVLETAVQSRVALLSGDGLRTLGSLIGEGTWPTPFYTTTFADRTKYADYSLTDVERRRGKQLDRIEAGGVGQADPDAWLAPALGLELHVALIQSRGGDVVFVRMPTCDERWERDEMFYPKAQFWDRFARITRARTIHFKDYPALANVDCPDTSHIDSKDGPAFTRGLLGALKLK